MFIKIANAEITDAPEIARIHVESWRAAYAGIIEQSWINRQDISERTEKWQDDLTTEKMKNKGVFLAKRGDQSLGFAVVGPARDKAFKKYAELWAIYLEPEYFSKGIGQSLFKICREYAKTKKFEKMYVNVLAENKRGRKFFEHAGGVMIAESRGKVQLGNHDYDNIRYEWHEL